MKTLVTGADGLLGSYIVRELLDKGHEVAVLILPGSPSPTLDGLPLQRIEADLLGDPELLEAACQGVDRVLHVAAVTDMRADPKFVWRVNHEGTQSLLEAARKAKVGRFAMIGSASSFGYGPIDRPGDETLPLPEAYRGVAYMESKRAAMEEVLKANETGGLETVVVAPTFLLGEYDWRPSSGEAIVRFLSKGLKSVPPGGRNFVHARDVARLAVKALDEGQPGTCVIAGGTNLTYLDFFTRVARIAGADLPRRILPRKLLEIAGALGSLYEKLSGKPAPVNRALARLAMCEAFYDSGRAQREFGYEPTPVEIGIEDSIRGLTRYGHLAAPQQDFAGKVALVTGGSRGVGFSMAAELARRGAKVAIAARGAQRLDDSKAKLERMGAEAHAVACDLSDPNEAQRAVAETIERFGRLDILINNAGVSMRGRLDEISPEVIDRVIGINLNASIHATRAAANALSDSGGNVLFISSVAGLLGLPGASVYSASKMALTGLAESLRLELGPSGVHVGVVYLGFTEHDPEKRILDANGQPALPDRPAHHSQNQAARIIIEKMKKRKNRIVMTPVGHLTWWALRIAPRTVERIIALAQRINLGMFKKFS